MTEYILQSNISLDTEKQKDNNADNDCCDDDDESNETTDDDNHNEYDLQLLQGMQ